MDHSSHSQSALDSIIEYAKSRIMNSQGEYAGYAKQTDKESYRRSYKKPHSRILMTCVVDIISRVSREFLQKVIDTLRQRPDCQEDLADIACLCLYGHAAAIQSACITLKEYYRQCPDIVANMGGQQPAYFLYGEALIHLSIGVIMTESLKIISRIKKDTLIEVLFMIHDHLYGKYHVTFLEILNTHVSSAESKDEEKLVESMNRYCKEIEDTVIQLLNRQDGSKDSDN